MFFSFYFFIFYLWLKTSVSNIFLIEYLICKDLALCWFAFASSDKYLLHCLLTSVFVYALLHVVVSTIFFFQLSVLNPLHCAFLTLLTAFSCIQTCSNDSQSLDDVFFLLVIIKFDDDAAVDPLFISCTRWDLGSWIYVSMSSGISKSAKFISSCLTSPSDVMLKDGNYGNFFQI